MYCAELMTTFVSSHQNQNNQFGHLYSVYIIFLYHSSQVDQQHLRDVSSIASILHPHSLVF